MIKPIILTLIILTIITYQKTTTFDTNCQEPSQNITSGNYTVKLCLKNGLFGYETKIELIHKFNGNYYFRQIDQGDIDQSYVLSRIYKTPKNIYDEIKGESDKIQINQLGEIQYQVYVHKVVKNIKFKTSKEYADENLLVKIIQDLNSKETSILSKIQTLNNSLRSSIGTVQNSMSVLDLRIKTIQTYLNMSQNGTITVPSVSAPSTRLLQDDPKQKINNEIISTQISRIQQQLNININSINSRITTLQNNQAKVNKDIQKLIKVQEQSSEVVVNHEIQQIFSIHKSIIEIKQFIIENILTIFQPSTNQKNDDNHEIVLENQKHFTIQSQMNKLSVVRYKGDMQKMQEELSQNKVGYYSGFLHPTVIENKRVTKIKIRQTKTTFQSVMYGISTNKTLGMKNPENSSQCISYYASNGYIWYNDTWMPSGHAINDESIIIMTANLIDWQVSWQIDGNQTFVSEIPQNMRHKKLYFIIMLWKQEDQIDILDF